MSQERRLMRRLERQQPECAGPRATLPQWTPQDEQDDRRNRLAERLLEILTEETVSADPDLCERMAETAKAALAAAEVIYPDVPEQRSAGAHFPKADGDPREHVTDGGLCWCEPVTERPLPEATRAGLESVSVRQNDAQGTIREGAWPMTPEEYARRLAAGEVGKRLVLIDHAEGADTSAMAVLLASPHDQILPDGTRLVEEV